MAALPERPSKEEGVSDDTGSFTIDLPVTGQGGIDAAATSVDSLVVRLESASKATQAASDAVKVAEASYSKAEGNVDKLSRALERVGVAADAQKAKLRVAADLGDTGAISRAEAQIRELARQEEQLASKVAVAKSALDAQAATLDKFRASAATAAATAAASEKALRDAQGKASGGAEEGVKWEKLERGLRKIGGPIEALGDPILKLHSGWSKVVKSLGENGPLLAATAGVFALAAAVVAASAALAAGVVQISAWAVGLADANGTAARLSQGIVRSVEGGNALNAQVKALARTLPLTQEEIQATAKDLASMGLRGKDLGNQLAYAAERAARLKFGPDFAKQMLTLDEQSKVFHLNLAETFGGLKTDALMRALQTMVALFDSSTASGHALQVVFESIFQPFIDKVAGTRFKVEAFFLHLEILALKGLIAIKPYGSLILKVGEAFLLGAAILGGAFALALGAVVVGLAAAVAGLGAFFYYGQVAFAWFTGLGVKIVTAVKSINLFELGKAMLQGLADGVLGGVSAVVSAVEGAAKGAVAAAKSILGIHSPSKVFAEIGMQTGAGMEQGVDASAPRVSSAMERVSSPPAVARAGSQATESRSSGGGASGSGAALDLSGAMFHFHGVEGAEDAESRFSALLTRLIEGDAAQLGGQSVAGT